jgi:hypothetical protein
MRTQSPDTSPEAERVQIELLRKATPARRFHLARSLSQTMIQVSRATIRSLHPEMGEEELKILFVEIYYGKELAEGVRKERETQMSLNVPDIVAAIMPVINVLEMLGVPYQIGGSVASSAYGFPRLTIDADLVVDLKSEHIEPLVKHLELDYYIDADAMRDAIRRRASFNAIHLATMIKVDIFVLKSRPFDQQAFRRMRQEHLTEDTPPVSLVSAEDVILNKLEWYRMGGEVLDRQWNDVLGVLKVQGASLDLAYLERWAAVLKVGDLLERALEDAGLRE